MVVAKQTLKTQRLQLARRTGKRNWNNGRQPQKDFLLNFPSACFLIAFPQRLSPSFEPVLVNVDTN